ncbi:hypothetical protein SpCBS45565_g00091 [Spizellomyces sp. 'palustris']|nr:hypothetical protein SpCBS45565_g00091 [Spizellomyces sp. 'palustris']
MSKRRHEDETVAQEAEGPSAKKAKTPSNHKSPRKAVRSTIAAEPEPMEVDKDHIAITKEEVDLYDRQIRLWGLEAQQRMRQAKILVAGVCGLSNEICKNLVLAGVGALTIMDGQNVSEEDLGAQFFLRKEDIGKNKAEASAPRIQALNPRVTLQVVTGKVESQSDPSFLEYDIVCLCNSDLQTMTRIDRLCRSNGIKFYSAGTAGTMGYIFCDLKEHAYIEERKSNKKDEVTVEKIEKSMTFPSLEETQQSIWGATSMSEMSRQQLRAFKAGSDPFWEKHSRLPLPGSSDDVNALLQLKSPYLKLVQCDASYVTDELLRGFARTARAEISPVCAILGGFAAQDILKVLSGKDAPLNNFFCFNGDEFSGKIIHLPPPVAVKAAGQPKSPQETMVID